MLFCPSILSNIVFLSRDNVVSIRKIDKQELFLKITNQIVTPQDEKTLNVWNEMLNYLVDIPSYLFNSRIDKESVDTLKNTIDK